MAANVPTLTGEEIGISPQGEDRFTMWIEAPMFGRVATVSLDSEQAVTLIAELSGALADR